MHFGFVVYTPQTSNLWFIIMDSNINGKQPVVIIELLASFTIKTLKVINHLSDRHYARRVKPNLALNLVEMEPKGHERTGDAVD